MNLPIIIDVITCAIILICMIVCSKKGFFASSQKLLSIILSLGLMFFLQGKVNTYLENSKVSNVIYDKVYESLSTKSEKTDTQQDKSTFLEKLGLPSIYNSIEAKKQEIEVAKDKLVQETSKNVTNSIINILSVFLLYIVIRIILFFLCKIFAIIFKLPILRTVNRFLGLICGLVQGLFIIYVICALLICFYPKNSKIDINNEIENSYITNYFYNNNYLLKLLK